MKYILSELEGEIERVTNMKVSDDTDMLLLVLNDIHEKLSVKQSEHAATTDELATLRAQLAEARETLQPFANVAKVWDGVNVMTSPIIAYSHADGDVLVYLDDFRAARAWYDKVTTA